MIRPYQKEDYETISDWWAARNVQGPTAYMLPESGGYVYEDRGEAVAVVFLYETMSRVGFVEWLTTRPGCSVLFARNICDELEKHLEAKATELGLVHLMGWVRDGVMTKEAVRNGYQLGGQVNHIYKEVI